MKIIKEFRIFQSINPDDISRAKYLGIVSLEKFKTQKEAKEYILKNHNIFFGMHLVILPVYHLEY